MIKGLNVNWSLWYDYILSNTRLDSETGLIYWKVKAKGRNLDKPVGCKDSNGYVKTTMKGIYCYVHQIVFLHYYGHWPVLVDHDNQNRSDNRPLNLVESSHSKNALNTGIYKTNTSGVKGVSCTQDGRFKVTVCGKFYGYFSTIEEAKEVADGCYS